LLQLIRKGNSAARKLARARILLKAAEGLSDAQIAKVLDLGTATVGRVRKRFVEEGLESALQERPRLGQRLKLDGKQQAHLLAVACTNPPQGHARWTLRLLAGRVVELGWAESISPETVRQVLKKQTSSPGRKSSGAFLR
jgi:transposase